MLAYAVLLSLAGIVALASGAGILVATKLFVVFMFGMLVPMAWLMGWDKEIDLSRSLISLTLGILPIGMLALVCARIGVEIGYAAIILTAVGAIIALSRPFNPTKILNITPWTALYGLACVVAFSGYLLNASGGAPHMTHMPMPIWSRDQQEHFLHVLELATSRKFPPVSLNRHGMLTYGHLLGQAWSAAIANMSHATPRAVFVLLHPLLTILGSSSVLYLILQRWNINKKLSWCVPLIGWLLPMDTLLFMRHASVNYFTKGQPLARIVKESWYMFHQSSINLYGIFICLVIVLVLDYFQAAQTLWQRLKWLGVLVFALVGLGLSKQPYFLGMLVALGLWSLVYGYQNYTQNKLFRILPAQPIFACLGAVVIVWLMTTALGTRGLPQVLLELKFGYYLGLFHKHSFSSMLAFVTSYAFVWLAIGECLVMRWRVPEPRLVLVLCLLVCPMLFTNAFVLMDYRYIPPQPHDDFLQITLPAFRAAWPLYIGLLLQRIASVRRMRLYYVGSMGLLALLTAGLSLQVLVRRYKSESSERFEKYHFEKECDISLAHLPRDSVIAVNGLPSRVFISPSFSYGHSMFMASADRHHHPATVHALHLQQRVLNTIVWEPSILCYAKKLGWTHYLVVKKIPHPANIPLLKLSDTERLAIYSFGVPPLHNLEIGGEALAKRLAGAIMACEG